jgi:hypothetical protein
MALWKDELMNLRDLDMTDDLVRYAFEDYRDLVYDMLVHESPKYASDLYHNRRFWTLRWQIDNKQRQRREKMFCHLEDITGGEVKRQLKKRGVHHMNTMRAFFFNRLGLASLRFWPKRLVSSFLECQTIRETRFL